MKRREGDSYRERYIFCMYAPADRQYYKELKDHFDVIGQQGGLYLRNIGVGEHIQQTIDTFVRQVPLILLLLSSDFFKDENCNLAMNRAFDEWQKREISIVPVLVRPCRLEGKCADFRVLPDNEKPVKNWRDRELAYENIVDGILRVLSKPRSERSRVFSVPALPRHYVEPQILQELKQLLLNARNSPAATNIIGLHGMGGLGKTTLALALCHDSEIKEAFDHGVLWIELGEQPPDEHALLQKLLVSLEVFSARAATLEQAREAWRESLHGRICLLVIDDVWSGPQGVLDTLLNGGPHCVRLVTTRQRHAVQTEVTWRQIGALTQKEAVDIFCKGLSDEMLRQAEIAAVTRLVVLLSCWPLLLTLARCLVFSLVNEYEETVERALQTVEQVYENQGEVVPGSGEQTLRECLEISLRHLEKSTEIARYRPLERYLELAIFPAGSEIPLVTLQKFWQRTGGLGEGETKILCRQLHRLSLLQTCTLGEDGIIRVHHAIHFFLYKEANDEKQQRFHQQLLQAYACQHWAQLPLDEPYLWRHLSRHLIQSGKSEEFVATVKDGNYLTAKIWVCNIYAVEADIDRAREQAPGDTSLRLLKRNLTLISHLLLRCASQDEIRSVLHSRLSPFPELAKICSDLESSALRPMLTSRHAFLDLADPALKRTLDNHKRGVRGCAIDPQGVISFPPRMIIRSKSGMRKQGAKR